ncbi:MAG: RDD family protein [Thermoanaerobaculia bacterium]
MGRESILGLDNIRLALPVAGIGSRSLAAFLDYLILALLSLLWVLFCAFLLAPLAETLGIVILLSGLFLLHWGWFAGQEIAMHGRTFGKRAMQLRVVTAEGGTAGPGALLIRNLVRSLDLLVGVVLMAVDPLSRRLGDRLAGTLVVHDRPLETGPVLGRVPPGWNARELAVVESFLARAETLEPPLRRQMAERILDAVRRDAPGLLADAAPGADPVAVLRRALEAEA